MAFDLMLRLQVTFSKSVQSVSDFSGKDQSHNDTCPEISEEMSKLSVLLSVCILELFDFFFLYIFFSSKCYLVVFTFYFSSLNADFNPTLPLV